MWRLPILAFFVAACTVAAQQDSTVVLANLAQQSKDYQRSIPNFTCNEVATTTVKKKDKVVERIEFQADVRVHRKDDKSLDEVFVITNYMGKPTPNGGKFSIPIYLEGGLSQGLPSFFEVDHHSCYDYRISPNRIDFHSRSEQGAECHDRVQTSGFGTTDEAGKLTHGEITRPAAEAEKAKEASLARIDYADVRLDDRVFRMPTHVYGEASHSGTVRTFDAYYTGCRLFAAKATVRPGDGGVVQTGP